MFYLIGIGLKPEHLTLEEQSAIAKCKEVYLESYTSVYSEGNVKNLEKLVKKKIKKLGRKGVEEEFKPILQKAKEQDIALLVFGNPLSATTHVQLLLDAGEMKIPLQVLPGISILNFLGKTGLSEYKFGRTTTIVFPVAGFEPESFYDVVVENNRRGLHTLCLLDIDAEQGKLMAVGEAIEILEKIEEKRGESVISDAVLIALSKAGSGKEKIVVGKKEALKKEKLETPAVLIVVGELDSKEKEALEKVGK